MVKRRGLLLAVLVAALVLGACGPETADRVVISLEGRSVPRSELVAEFNRLHEGTAWAQADPAERKEFVENFAHKELLVKHVHETIGTQLSDRELREYRRWLDGEIVSALWDTLAAREEIPAARRDSLARVRSYERQMVHVSSRSGRLMRLLGEHVAGGEELVRAARALAGEHPGSLMINSEVWVNRTQLPDPLADSLFGLTEVGAQAGPFDTGEHGWHILRFDGERWLQEELEESQYLEALEQKRRDASLRRQRERIREAYDFELVTEDFEPIHRAFGALFDSLAGDNPRSFSADLAALRPPLHHLTPEERQQPLVEWNGGGWTVGQYVASLDSTNLFFWPGIGGHWRIPGRILLRMEEWAARQEAQRLGIGDSPRFIRSKERKRDELLLDRFYAQRIQAQAAEVAPEQVRSYWEARREEYESRPTATYGYLWVPQDAKAVAERFVGQVRAGGEWETLGGKLATRDSTVGFQSVVGGEDAARMTELTGLVLDVELGEERPVYTDPLPFDNGWVVLAVYEQQPAEVLDFAAAEPEARRDLQREIMERELLATLDDLGEQYGLVIDWEAVD